MSWDARPAEGISDPESVSLSGSTQIASAVATKVRVLHALAIHNASGAPVACSVKSNTTIRGEWTLADDQSIVLPFAAEGWCASAAGQSLEFVAAAGVTGIATYSTQTL